MGFNRVTLLIIGLVTSSVELFGQHGVRLQLQLGHSEKVNAVAFSGDGALLFTGGDDGSVVVWERSSGRELRRILAHTAAVRALAISSDGRYLATASEDHTAIVWDVQHGRKYRTLRHDRGIMSISFSPDNRLLLTGSKDFTARVWKVLDGSEVSKLKHKNWVSAVSFSSDGKYLLTGCWDNVARLWDAKTHKLVFEFHPTGRWRVEAAAFSRDSRLVLVGAANVDLFDVPSRQAVASLAVDGVVKAIATSADGKYLVASANDIPKHTRLASDNRLAVEGRPQMPVYLWNLQSHREMKRFVQNSSLVLALAISPDGHALLEGENDGDARLLGFPSGVEIHRLMRAVNTPTTAAMLSAMDSHHLMVGTLEGTVNIWELNTGALQHHLVGHERSINSLTVTTNARTVLTASDDHTACIWDMTTFKCRRLIGHTAPVTSAAFAPSERFVVTGGEDKTARMWDVESGREIGKPLNTCDRVTAVAVSPDSNWIATGEGEPNYGIRFDADRKLVIATCRYFPVQLWSVKTLEKKAQHTEHNSFITSVSFSHDGATLLSSDADGVSVLWDIATRSRRRRFDGPPGPFTRAALSNNGSSVVTTGGDRSVRLWDVGSGTQLRELIGHDDAVTAATFSDDDRFVVTASRDGTVRLWNAATGSPVATLVDASNGSWVVVSPDGRFDSNAIEGHLPLQWIANGESNHALPVEIFMRDYFEPRLLPRLLAGKEFKPVRPLADLNRAQPLVEVKGVDERGNGLVQVTVAVTSRRSTVQKDGGGRYLASGVYDVRLFRDGQMVGQCPKQNGQISAALEPIVYDKDRQAWREAHRVVLDASGKATVTFHNIRLPQRAGASDVTFTAYAFNADRVKSLTSRPFVYKGRAAPTAAVTRKAYLITVGVNANQSHNLDLELAVSSAEKARSLLAGKLQTAFPQIVEIPLYSDLTPEGNEVKLTGASKAALRAVLDLLAGRRVDRQLREDFDPKHQLRAATPDDAVVLYVASHGYADPRGNFYLMPYDTGSHWGITEDVLSRCLTKAYQSRSCSEAQDLLHHSISSADLTEWWSGVDAGKLVMILDTCHSGAVPGREFRPGPLGDPGFGQLSYDKGMQILSASQPAQTERGEWVTGGEGRTLLVDALEGVVRANPQQPLEEWLRETERQLPIIAKQLYPELTGEDIPVPLLLDFTTKIGTPVAAH